MSANPRFEQIRSASKSANDNGRAGKPPQPAPDTKPEPITPPETPDLKPAPPKTLFVWGDEFCKQPPASNSIIRGILDYDSLACEWGDSGAGKSFLTLDRDCHIANGMNWCGRKTKQGIVLYIAGEGKHGLIKRVKAWHEYRNLPVSKNIAFRTVPTALCDPKAVNELVAEIKLLLSEMNCNPAIIDLDTLNRNFGPGDENSTKDMTSFVAGMDALRLATGAAINTIHHCGHGAKDRGRGSIVLHNSMDFECCVSKTGECLDNYVTTMEFIKIKDYDKPQPLSWKWKHQALPWAEEDDDGNMIPMSSVVLVPTDYVEPAKGASLGGKQLQALNILKSLHEQHRQNLIDGGHDPKGARVSVEDWSTAMRSVDPDKSNRSNTRKSLVDRKLVIISDGYANVA